MKPRILVASPVCQQPFILAYFLYSLRSLKRDGLIVDFLFIDDNEEEEARDLLTLFRSKEENVEIIRSENEKEVYKKDEETHYWTEQLIQKSSDNER